MIKYLIFNILKKIKIFVYTSFFLLSSCNSSQKINTMLLNGYWKIDFVSQGNENFKLKGGTFLLDYYFINKNTGWRKKVRPLINNNFETSNDTTFFKIKNLETKPILLFNTRWHNWEEMIVKLDTVSLILKIQDKTYHYQKFNP